MKSLRESLFDRDLADKDVTFGGLYEFSHFKLSSGDYKLTDLFKKTLIKKDSGVSSSDSEEQIVNGLAKIILNTPVDIGLLQHEFNERLFPLVDYYTSLSKSSFRVGLRQWPYSYGYNRNGKIIITDWTIGEPDTIEVLLIGMELIFKKK